MHLLSGLMTGHCLLTVACPVLAVVRLDPKADYSRMKVGELKQLLTDRGIDTRDCFEKDDFVSKVRKLAAAA